MKRLILPLPPSVNHSHRQVVNGHRVMRVPTVSTKEFMTESGWRAVQWARQNQWQTVDGQKVVLRYWIFWPDKKKRDAGNVEKVMTDSLIGILFRDDRWVLPRAMDFSVDRKNPRVELELEVMDVS